MFFTKLQSVGNDFILIETSDTDCDWATLARSMCHRRFGIGSDGLLLLIPTAKADFRMRMFNPDGTEAEACGNGIRCLIKYCADMKLTDNRIDSLTIETAAGLRKAGFCRKDGKADRIQTSMGKPEFEVKKIPVALESCKGRVVSNKLIAEYPVPINGTDVLLNFVSMGNPHAVYFQDKPVNEFPLCQIGPIVEHHKEFPRRVNFEVARVINRKQIDVRVWERGACETLGCGTGACAVAVTSRLLGYTDNNVNIKLPGGVLEVDWDGEGEVYLSGIAEIVFAGDWKK